MRSATARAARPAKIDVDLIASQIHVALTGLAGSETEAKRNDDLASRYAGVAESARAAAQRRRIEIGTLLLQARPAWPASGTGAAGWGAFLKRVRLDDATARRYMAEARNPAPSAHGREEPARLKALLAEYHKLGAADRKAFLGEIKPATVSGGSGDADRGAWCTSKLWAERVGPWDLDPFSNVQSHIVAEHRCMLEDGGDGLAEPGHPGCWTSGGSMLADGTWASGDSNGPTLLCGVADETTRVWIQPPYSILERVVAHYGHTRFCALLRLDPSTEWFAALWERTQVLAIPKGTREMFEPPPGVPASSNPQPHAFYYADPRDITPAIAESCIVLSRYEARAHPALKIVR